MKREEILVKLQEIFREVFGKNNLIISEETNASDIEEWDSLMHISILEAVQEDFSVSFALNEIVEMKNVGDMVSGIQTKM